MISCQKGVPWAPQSPQVTPITRVIYYITHITRVIDGIQLNLLYYPGKFPARLKFG